MHISNSTTDIVEKGTERLPTAIFIINPLLTKYARLHLKESCQCSGLKQWTFCSKHQDAHCAKPLGCMGNNSGTKLFNMLSGTSDSPQWPPRTSSYSPAGDEPVSPGTTSAVHGAEIDALRLSNLHLWCRNEPQILTKCWKDWSKWISLKAKEQISPRSISCHC